MYKNAKDPFLSPCKKKKKKVQLKMDQRLQHEARYTVLQNEKVAELNLKL